MAPPCVAVPTLTTTQVSTSESLVTTSTESISTAPGSVSTVVLSTCVQLGSSSQCQPTISTSFVTLPGSTATVNVPVILTVDVPMTVLATLFGSSCSSNSISSTASSTSSIHTSISSSSSSSSTLTSASLTSPSTSPSMTAAPVIVTPAPLLVTSTSLVTSDGSTFLSLFTSTSTFPATTLQAQPTASPSDRRVATGPVVGGVVGGFALLLLLGLLTWRVVKRQSRFDDFFNPDDIRYGPRHTDPLIEKKPSYQYGMVGRPGSNPIGVEPPYLPPTVQNASGNGGQGQGQQSAAGGQVVIGNNGGLSQASGPLGNVGGSAQASGPPGALGTDGGLGQTVTSGHGVVGNLLPIAHPGNSSLIAGIGTAAAASGVYAAAAATPSNSRPSTGSSSQALGPLVSPAKSQGYYPPGLQTHVYHAGPSSPPNSSISSVLPSMGASSHQQQQQRTSFGPQATDSNDYEYQRYAGMGSASSSSSSSMGGAASSSSQEAPLYDEQGRPSNMPPEKAPLVHLDGTLYQQPPSGGSRSGNAPPAYIE